MTSLVAEALDTYVAAQDLSPIAALITASEGRRGPQAPPPDPRLTYRRAA